MARITQQTQHEEYTIKRYDPYGFCQITKTNSGATPQYLTGDFTSIEKAKSRIDDYYKNKAHETMKKIEEARKPENFKYKKPKEVKADVNKPLEITAN